MSMKHVFFAAALVMVLGLATPQAQAQVISGGYVGFGRPGFGGVVAWERPWWPRPPSSPHRSSPTRVPYSARGCRWAFLRRTLLRGRLGLWTPLRLGYGPRYYSRGYGYGYRRRWW